MQLRHHHFDRITFDSEKCFGKACIRGLRFPVSSILAYLSSGMTLEQVLQEWPELEAEDLSQALAYAAAVLEERIVPLGWSFSAGETYCPLLCSPR
ncbi:MAG TPA: DUF433 domain-containing protein [Thermoanaerobaculia bacterium]|nr:DUF433 domain-containing protein [Thermoanaerobaculia bacterium]